jgi:hypothetical protein
VSVIPAFRRLGQEDQEFKRLAWATLARPCQQTNKQKDSITESPGGRGRDLEGEVQVPE